jgi:hypothetical protein
MSKHVVKCTAEWEYTIDLESGAYDFAEGDLFTAVRANADVDLFDLFNGTIKFTQQADNVNIVTLYPENND